MLTIKCAYCGIPVSKRDREHVVPKCLYPASKSGSKIQRLTIPACKLCNNSFSDDEAHFRNVLLLAGEPNDAVYELWSSTARRSFNQVDGMRRVMDLFEQMKPIKTPDGDRYKIYPAKDERVVRIVRKIIRGLCHFHKALTPVADRRVWADVLKYVVPQEFLDEMPIHHRDQHIFEYRYRVLHFEGIHSAWLLTFYKTRTFIGLISESDDGFSEAVSAKGGLVPCP